MEEPRDTVNPIRLILQIVITAFVFHLGEARAHRGWGLSECDYPQDTIGHKESIAFGTAVFNKPREPGRILAHYIS